MPCFFSTWVLKLWTLQRVYIQHRSHPEFMWVYFLQYCTALSWSCSLHGLWTSQFIPSIEAAPTCCVLTVRFVRHLTSYPVLISAIALFCHLSLYPDGVLFSWRMDWMSRLVSWNFIDHTSNLSQGNAWKYCTRLPIPITVSLSSKAITGNQSTSQHRYGPKKSKICFLTVILKSKPVLKGASLNVLSHSALSSRPCWKSTLCSKWSHRLFSVLLWGHTAHFCAQLVVLLSTCLCLFPLPVDHVLTSTQREIQHYLLQRKQHEVVLSIQYVKFAHKEKVK